MRRFAETADAIAGTPSKLKKIGALAAYLRDLSEEQFQEHLRRSNDLGRRYIVNFSREKIFGGGVGHHSPIGGYLEPEDLVFVLDVNPAYQPWLVERRRLFDAVNTLDGDRKRGLLLPKDRKGARLNNARYRIIRTAHLALTSP